MLLHASLKMVLGYFCSCKNKELVLTQLDRPLLSQFAVQWDWGFFICFNQECYFRTSVGILFVIKQQSLLNNYAIASFFSITIIQLTVFADYF